MGAGDARAEGGSTLCCAGGQMEVRTVASAGSTSVGVVDVVPGLFGSADIATVIETEWRSR